MYSPGRSLTDDIKDNLVQKASLYMESSQADQPHKAIIFTDSVHLWKDNPNVTINGDLPLPPIPADFDRRTRSHDILVEMLEFIAEVIEPSYACRNTHLWIYNTGDAERPQAHVIFSPKNIVEPAFALLKSIKTASGEVKPWYHFDN